MNEVLKIYFPSQSKAVLLILSRYVISCKILFGRKNFLIVSYLKISSHLTLWRLYNFWCFQKEKDLFQWDKYLSEHWFQPHKWYICINSYSHHLEPSRGTLIPLPPPDSHLNAALAHRGTQIPITSPGRPTQHGKIPLSRIIAKLSKSDLVKLPSRTSFPLRDKYISCK